MANPLPKQFRDYYVEDLKAELIDADRMSGSEGLRASGKTIQDTPE